MSKASRNKGQEGEREVCKLLGDAVGLTLNRTLDQTRDGGCDIICGDWAVEVKRQERLNLKDWWGQAVHQAKAIDKHPVLFYRQSRDTWKVVMPFDLDTDPLKYWVHGDLELFLERIGSVHADT